ncbi:MAG: phage Gp37/Gp68 family protein [Gammaproteobacteria bacterium]|nr:phage Gp37/Gp68 family protein [Gammaproteobacteria bacterium]
MEWTRGDDGRPGETWNPVTGCSKVSAGCKNCYAERVFPRPYPGRKFTDVRTHPDRLDQPLRWRRPRRVFVNSMSDLFHADVPDTFILEVLDIIRRTSYDGGSNVGKLGDGEGEHTFQVLTKRPERMRDFLSRLRFRFNPRSETESALYLDDDGQRPAVLKNLWLGVSCEDQETADERIPLLLQTPAAVRFVSAEPLLAPINFTCVQLPPEYNITITTPGLINCLRRGDEDRFFNEHATIDWVIVGGESGPGARVCNVDWVQSIVEQCKAANVPVFVKQLGSRWQLGGMYIHGPLLKDRKGGDPDEWPEDLRVREFPQ